MSESHSIWQHSRAYTLALAAFGGIFMFGYDVGLGGGLIAMPSFQRRFGLDLLHGTALANEQGTLVSILQGGCLTGSVLVAPLTYYIGRQRALIINCLFFFLGAALMVSSTALPQFKGGRFVVGLGVGAMSMVCPTYVAELAPKHIRGRISGLFQVINVFGICASYWVVFGAGYIDPARGDIQWRVPVGLQLAPVGLMFMVLPFMPESPRWLATKGKHEQALKSLAWIRKTSVNDVDTIAEYAEIQDSVEELRAASEGKSWREMFKKTNSLRFAIAFLLFTAQQWSGQNSINYYAPTIFASIGITGSNTSMLASGVYGVVKVVATSIFVMFGIEKFGRRMSLVCGLAAMSVFLWIIGAIFNTHPPNPHASGPSSASIAMAAFIYIYVIPYCFSVGPIPWVYCGEIFNNQTRTWGMMVASASQWVWNLILTRFTPNLINALKDGGVFFFFAALCIISSFCCWFLPETRGRSLEEMDIVFSGLSQEEREAEYARRDAVIKAEALDMVGENKQPQESRKEHV